MARGAQSLCRPPLLLCHIAGREPIDPKKTETVTYEQLAEHINYCSTYKAENNIIIVDVRPPEEIRKYGGMIPTAHNVPLDNIEQALSMTNHEGFELEFGFKMPQRQSDSLLFYCKLGGRAQKACSIAKSLGYQTICYPGSWIEWKEKSEQQVKS